MHIVVDTALVDDTIIHKTDEGGWHEHRAVAHHRYRPVLSNISAGVTPARLRAASSST